MSARNTPTPRARLNKSSTSLASTTKDTALRTPATNRSLVQSSQKPLVPTPASRSTSKLPIVRSTAANSLCTPSSLFRSTVSNAQRSVPATPKSAARRFGAASMDANHDTPECFAKVSLDTPSAIARRPLLQRSNTVDELKPKDQSEISNLSVAVRVRPMNSKECTQPGVSNIISVRNNEIKVSGGATADASAGVTHRFQYDHAFWCCNQNHENFADQEQVFRETAMPLMDNAFDGYNACLFAYGQTGSGKSYSMMGIDVDDIQNGIHPEAGIIPRFCQELFQRIDSLKDQYRIEVEISYFEIYNEKIHDLLAVSSSTTSTTTNTPSHSSIAPKRAALRVREHPTWGPYVVDLSTHPVDSHTALRNWLAVGNSQRATAATGMNDKSSRSHSIFNIVLNLADIRPVASMSLTEDPTSGQPLLQTRRSKISLVDLAGSERVSHTCASGERLREGVSINKSLLTLGKVISALADARKSSAAFVPYRESVLTWLLRENLGGNSRTMMLATISPACIHLDETLATLRYACQARTIVNRVKVNEDPHDRQIRELRAEVERLQVLQQDYERQKRNSVTAAQPTRTIIIETSVDESEVEALRQQLAETEQELVQAQRSWRDRLHEAEAVRKTEMKLLQRNGLALEISSAQKQPCLVNLAADPMLSGTLLYILPLGMVRIGRPRPSAFEQPDIVLDGPLVAFNHCSIENRRGDLFVEPQNEEFETFVNGEAITDRTQIYNGDRVVIGGSHYFRVSNPHCTHRTNETIDFQLAHQEVLRQQELRLRDQLDAEKNAALRQIEDERAANERQYTEKMASLELEQFRYKCSKEILETEKLALEQQQMKVEPQFEHKPYESNLLDEIKRILAHPSEECLHQTQLKVKEATQRCRDLGLDHLEFMQTQVADEFGMFKAVINIIDRDNHLIAEWPPARLDVWLDIIRDADAIDADTLFASVDIDWQEHFEDASDKPGDSPDHNASLNSSRISLNLNAVKEAILGKSSENTFKNIRNIFTSPFSPSNTGKKDSMLKSTLTNQAKGTELTKKRLMYDEEVVPPIKTAKPTPTRQQLSPGLAAAAAQTRQRRFEEQSLALYKDLRKTTLKFKKLCHDQRNGENIPDQGTDANQSANQLMQLLEQIEVTSNKMRHILNAAEGSSKSPKSVRFLVD